MKTIDRGSVYRSAGFGPVKPVVAPKFGNGSTATSGHDASPLNDRFGVPLRQPARRFTSPTK